MTCSAFNCNRSVVARGWCRLHYNRWYRHGDAETLPPRQHRTQQSPETRAKIAEKAKGRVVSAEVRQRQSDMRRGTWHDNPMVGSGLIRGYRYLYGRYDHPLSKKGQVAEHRAVLYDNIGAGPHFCYWGCGKTLEWGGKSGIQADHLDGDPLNNDPENLVPSCGPCNTKRALAGNPKEWAGSC